MDKYSQRLPGPRGPLSARPGALANQWFTRVVGIVVGTAIAVGALFVSVIAFSVILVVGLVVGGWLWWRTREVRRRFREEMARMQQAMENATGGISGGNSPGHDAAPGSGAEARGGGPAGRARGFDDLGATPGGHGRAPREGDVLDGDYIREAPSPGASGNGSGGRAAG